MEHIDLTDSNYLFLIDYYIQRLFLAEETNLLSPKNSYDCNLQMKFTAERIYLV